MLTDYDEILRGLLPHRRREIIEIRHRSHHSDSTYRVTGRRFVDATEAGEYAAEVSARPQTIAVWHQLNRIDSAAKIAKLLRDEHIARRTRLLIDLDTVRGPDTNATESELHAAYILALWICWYLHEIGVSGFTLVMSGNGYQILAAIDEPSDSDIVERVLKFLAARFDTDRVKIDTTTTNASRMVKLPGTAARKGLHSAERPNRMARIVRVFGDDNIAPTDVLESMAVTRQTETQAAPDSFDSAMATEFKVGDWLTENGVTYRAHDEADGVHYEIACPFKPGHTDGGAVIIQKNDGSVNAYCHHRACKGKTWSDFRMAIDPHYRLTLPPPSRQTVRDAEYLARRFLETCPPCYLYRSEVWLYQRGVYVRQETDDLKNAICLLLMRVYREFATRMKGKKVSTPSVGESTITNVLRCIRSILPRIHDDRDMPTWTNGEKASVLVVENGVLDLTTYQLSPHTPRLFARFKLPYQYDPAATCPKFAHTVASIFDDPAEVALLQEQFGATIVGGNERRVAWLWQGATHGGKGVLTRALCGLVGRENTVSIRAGSFGDQFSLWGARGALLIVVPDINGKKPLPGAFIEIAKIVSGSDPVNIDGKNRHAVCETLPGKLLLVTNDSLQMSDDSGALFNRFRCLKFVHHFFKPGDRLYEPGRVQNENLENELVAELPGILNWSLAGLRRLNKDGFTNPAESVALREELEADGAPVQTYALERLTRDATRSALTSDVYADFLRWCADQQAEPLALSHFGIALRAAMPTVKRKREKGGRRQYYYFGVTLKK